MCVRDIRGNPTEGEFAFVKRAADALSSNLSGSQVTVESLQCSGQVISDSSIDFFDVDSRSKALGDKLPSFECSLRLL